MVRRTVPRSARPHRRLRSHPTRSERRLSRRADKFQSLYDQMFPTMPSPHWAIVSRSRRRAGRWRLALPEFRPLHPTAPAGCDAGPDQRCRPDPTARQTSDDQVGIPELQIGSDGHEADSSSPATVIIRIALRFQGYRLESGFLRERLGAGQSAPCHQPLRIHIIA